MSTSDDSVKPPSKFAEKCVGPQSTEAGTAPSCQGCPNASLCASGQTQMTDEVLREFEMIRERLSSIKHVVLILSGKGGVGKSTVTRELALRLSSFPETSVNVLDVDLCGPSMPRLFGVRAETIHFSAIGWEPVPVKEDLSVVSIQFMMRDPNEAVVWRGPRKDSLIRKWLAQVDWGLSEETEQILLIDTPPGTSDEHISLVSILQQCHQSISALLVSTPQAVSVADVRREVTFCRKTNLRVIGLVENMAGVECPKCHCLSPVFSSGTTSHVEQLAKETGLPLLARVPLDLKLRQACEQGQLESLGCSDATLQQLTETVVKLL